MIRRGDMSDYKITHLYKERCVLPDIAIDRAWREFKTGRTEAERIIWRDSIFVTTDGVRVRLDFLGTTTLDADAEDWVQRIYGIGVGLYREIWEGRAGKGIYIGKPTAWNLCKMIKV